MRQHLSASALSLLLIVLLSSPIHAEGKITTDPNTPGAKPIERQSTSPDEDAALSKKITYDGPDLDLTAMLSQISKLSGVRMQPSSAKDNWQVRQRTAIVFMNDAPLSGFKNGLAKLFSYRWSHVKQTDGSRPYVLRELDAKKLSRQEMIEAEKQAQIEANRANIEAAIDAAERSTKLTADQIKDARENDPWLYYLAVNPSGQRWAEVIRGIPSDWWEDAAFGKSISLGATKTNDLLNQKIIALAEQILKLSPSGTSMACSSFYTDQPRPDYSTYRSDPLEEFRISPGAISITVRRTTPHEDGSVEILNQQLESCPVGPSDSFQCRVAGTVSTMAEGGKPLDEVRQPALDKVCAYLNAKNKDPEPDSTIDPALLKVIEHKPLAESKKNDEPSLITHLRGLAKETGFTMMVETFDYPSSARKTASCAEKGTIFSMLNDLCKTSGTIWEKSDNLVLFRYKDWPKLRAWEIDNDLIKRWEDAAKAKGYLSFGDLYDVANNLTHDQVLQTLSRNKLLSLAGIDKLNFGPYYGFLAAASMLPEDQRRAFLSETGVPIKLFGQVDLTSDPKAKELQSWIDQAAREDENATIGIYEKPPLNGRNEVHFFSRYADGRSNNLDWTLASQDDIKAVEDYVKSLEKSSTTAAP